MINSIFNQFNLYPDQDQLESFDDNVTYDYNVPGTAFLIGSNQGSNTRFTLDSTTTPTPTVGFLITIGGSDRIDQPMLFNVGQKNIRIFQSSGTSIQSLRFIRGYQ